MIKQIVAPNKDSEIFEKLNPLVKEWFKQKFEKFTESQRYSIIPIKNRRNILVSSPTGSGKTLCAFASILDYLISLAGKNELEEKIYCVYISPLKALSNDVHFNLEQPLAEIKEIARKKGVKLQDIRVKKRTGDTTPEEKQKMLRKAPHILITTPESLAIVLSSKKFVELLQGVEYVIIDEIHALAVNKRGVHLSLSLERLEEISKIVPVRIGLSATIAPLDEVARFLVGYEPKGKGKDSGKGKGGNKGENKEWGERGCLIANVPFAKKTDLKVLCPLPDLIDTTARQTQESLYGLLDKLVQEHKTTLIFTNTRSATERVINHLKEMFPSRYLKEIETIGAHHSSLSKEMRFKIEQALREGKLKCVVTSTSLELGIDIGYIDLVILLGSPKSVARALQRQGRAGHKLHDVSKGRIIVLDRDDLVECSVLLKEAIEKKIDKVQIPKNCLDVLSQHIYGSAIQKIWPVNEFFNLVRKSYCYHNLSREDFFSVISYLSGEYAGLEERSVYAKIWYDAETKQFGKRGRLARMIYMTNIGTIPEESFVRVIVASPQDRRGQKIGMIDEGFLERLKKNDVFVLGGHRYQFLYSRGMNAYVNATVYRPPTIPSWFSEILPLNFDLALAIQHFRKLMGDLLTKQENKKADQKEIEKFISDYLYVDKNSVKALYNYFYEQFKFSKIPHEKRLVIEHYTDHENKHYIIFHSLYGRRVNDALSRALAFLVARAGRRDVEIGINDNGFYLASHNKMQAEKALNLLKEKPQALKQVLEEAIDKTETFKRRFRHCATRSLMILRKYFKKERKLVRERRA